MTPKRAQHMPPEAPSGWLQLRQVYDQVTSTMTLAASQAAAGAPEGTTIIAKTQTAGRGRRGRHWLAVADAGLWCTTILRPPPHLAGSQLAQLSLVAGAAVVDALKQLGLPAASVGLKWPNDVVWRHGDNETVDDPAPLRKLGGVLLEAVAQPKGSNGTPKMAVLVGVGINLRAKAELGDALPPEVAPVYAGLADVTHPHPPPCPDTLQEIFLSQLRRHYSAWQIKGLELVHPLWQAHDVLTGAQVRAWVGESAGQVAGLAAGLAADGNLQVQTADGRTAKIKGGEVLRVRRVASPDGFNQEQSETYGAPLPR